MRLDHDSKNGGCFEGSQFLYNFTQLGTVNDARLSLDAINEASKPDSVPPNFPSLGAEAGYLCQRNLPGGPFNVDLYKPAILTRIDQQRDILYVDIREAIMTNIRLLKTPFQIQLNNRDCFGAVNESRPEGGLLIYHKHHLTDLREWQ